MTEAEATMMMLMVSFGLNEDVVTGAYFANAWTVMYEYPSTMTN